MRLHLRLALSASVLLTLCAVLLGLWLASVAQRYQAEVTQRLNASVAMYVTDELALLGHGGVNHGALDELSRRVMTVNPSAEVYLLDPNGRIVATLVPRERLRRTQVDLAAINDFMRNAHHGPLYGDDPTDANHGAVFSAAPVANGGTLHGYLYVVLGGQRFDTVAAALRGSYSLQLGIGVATALLFVTLLIASGLFALLTLPLRHLTRRMVAWSEHMGIVDAHGAVAADEITALKLQFDTLSMHIENQVAQIKRSDAQRRELIASISHDLRTPLASLHGYLETVLLKGEQLPTAMRRQYLSTALRNSEQVSTLIAALFELSKLEAGVIAPQLDCLSMAELIQDIALRFRLRAQQLGVEIGTVVDPAAPAVLGDVSLIERIFENLLDNALRNTQHGERIELGMQAARDCLHIRVKDTGRGINKTDLPHVFERLYRGAQQGSQGCGLGLSIVRRIVELHGGSVTVASEAGAGTTVQFTLPYAQPVTRPLAVIHQAVARTAE